jgi:hypothetical protein
MNPAPTKSAAFVAEERIAIANAERELVNFSLAWPGLPVELKPSALRSSLFALVILWLDNALRAQIFLADVAHAAGLEVAELRRLVERRADVCRNYRELWQRSRVAVENEVLGWML